MSRRHEKLTTRGILSRVQRKRKRVEGAAVDAMSMQTFEIQAEKSLVKPKDSEVEKLTAVFDPKLFREMEHLEVQNLEKTGTIDINLIFSHLTSQSSSLRHVVHTCANHWIKSVVPANLVKNFSTSTAPKPPQTTFPSDLINGPVDVLVRGLKIEGLDADEMSHTIGLLFNHHLTSVFNHARSADAKRNQRIAMDDGPPPNKIGKV
ncbi:hypothetical protein GCK72_004352 [Caenorhabditis remanei]|uniref:Uncharacterized protein n=1 Tax=Caenorhabditis remanei TaxID=31234 RepID=A0A6A5HB11_CAERE|nr:hypothetical protein GCK72_004352 [Caenorhabditis remanei]KAF1764405.1 hypothetical protein GCK72_004352 [Caenorhabditis remanei]